MSITNFLRQEIHDETKKMAVYLLNGPLSNTFFTKFYRDISGFICYNFLSTIAYEEKNLGVHQSLQFHNSRERKNICQR